MSLRPTKSSSLPSLSGSTLSLSQNQSTQSRALGVQGCRCVSISVRTLPRRVGIKVRCYVYSNTHAHEEYPRGDHGRPRGVSPGRPWKAPGSIPGATMEGPGEYPRGDHGRPRGVSPGRPWKAPGSYRHHASVRLPGVLHECRAQSFLRNLKKNHII